MHLAYIWIVSHLSAKNSRNWWKFDEVLTKTNLLSFFGTRCTYEIKRHRTYMAKYWMPFAIIGPYRAIRRGLFGGIMFGGCCPGFRGSASLLLALRRVNRLPVALLLVFRAA